jgi:hypothetical protein
MKPFKNCLLVAVSLVILLALVLSLAGCSGFNIFPIDFSSIMSPGESFSLFSMPLEFPGTGDMPDPNLQVYFTLSWATDPASFHNWVLITPEYNNYQLGPTATTMPVQITVQVPPGTPPGLYEFKVKSTAAYHYVYSGDLPPGSTLPEDISSTVDIANVSITVVPDKTYPQSWQLDSNEDAQHPWIDGNFQMEKAQTSADDGQSGFVEIPAGTKYYWLADQPAMHDVTFAPGFWIVELVSNENWASYCKANIGYGMKASRKGPGLSLWVPDPTLWLPSQFRILTLATDLPLARSLSNWNNREFTLFC